VVANSVVSNRQARLATKAYLKRKLALPLTEAEEKSIAHLTARSGFEPDGSGDHAAAPHGGRKQARKIRIEINWSPGNQEVICDPKASDSFVRFVTRLYEVNGMEALDKLAGRRFSRGVLLSKSPRKDFRYTRNDGSQGDYANQPIAKSGYALLTHGETWQKTSDISEICRVVGIPSGTVKVEEIEKGDLLRELLA
jgi:hypothetical protein